MRSTIYEVSDLLAISICGLCEKLRVLCVKPRAKFEFSTHNRLPFRSFSVGGTTATFPNSQPVATMLGGSSALRHKVDVALNYSNCFLTTFLAPISSVVFRK